MYFNTKFINDKLYIWASLPYLNYDITNKDTSISYYNRAFLLEKGTKGKTTNYIEFKNLSDSLYTINHLNSFSNSSNTHYFFPLSRGWPNGGSQIEIENSDYNTNPFLQDFYKSAYSMAIYDKSGSFIAYFQMLDDRIAKLKTGYFDHKPLISFSDENTFWYTDRKSGTIYKYSFPEMKLQNSIEIFDIEPLNVPPINFYKNQLSSYLFDSHKLNFENTIIDICEIDKKIFVLIKEDNQYYLTHFYLKNKKYASSKQKFYIKNEINNSKIREVVMKLGVSKNTINIIALYEGTINSFLGHYKISLK